MAQKYKYIDKHYLNIINGISRDVIKYNRSITQSAIDALPDDKFFPVIFSMVHEHIEGKPVEPHMRCIFLVPDIDGNGRKRLILDMEMGLYDLLPEVEVPDENQTNEQPQVVAS